MERDLNIFQNPEVDVNINGGPTNIQGLLGSYDCVVLKPNKKGSKNVLDQWMMSAPHTKYVIRYDFNLQDTIIEVPEDCIIEIDCGSLQHGTLVGNDTILLNPNEVDNALVDITLSGTWVKTYADKVEDLKPVAFSGSYNDLEDKPDIPVIPDNIQYVDSGEIRPENPAVGQSFFDTTLGEHGKPIWYAGDNVWVDADGNSVDDSNDNDNEQ